VPLAGCRIHEGMSVLATTARYTLLVASEGAQVRAAQRLRH